MLLASFGLCHKNTSVLIKNLAHCVVSFLDKGNSWSVWSELYDVSGIDVPDVGRCPEHLFDVAQGMPLVQLPRGAQWPLYFDRPYDSGFSGLETRLRKLFFHTKKRTNNQETVKT